MKHANFVNSSYNNKKQTWSTWWKWSRFTICALLTTMVLLTAWQGVRYASYLMSADKVGAHQTLFDSSTKMQHSLSQKKKTLTAQQAALGSWLTTPPSPYALFETIFSKAPQDSKITAFSYIYEKQVRVALAVNLLTALSAYRDALAPDIRCAPLKIASVGPATTKEKNNASLRYEAILEATCVEKNLNSSKQH
jgi:hypothetical protein